MSNAKELITAYIEADVPVFVWGAPGIGKSDTVHQCAKDLGLPIMDVRALLLEAIDLRGLPYIKDNVAVWSIPDFLPRIERDGVKGILFLDELNAASQQVQAACYQLILNRKVGDYELPSGWRVVAAGNRETDNAVVSRMPTPLANRFAHVEMEVNASVWASWASTAGIDPRLIAYINFRPEALYVKPVKVVPMFPTPRSWARVSSFIDRPEAIRQALITGLVGSSAANEFIAFLGQLSSVITFDAVTQEPEKTPIPANPSNAYAVIRMLAKGLQNLEKANRGLPGNFVPTEAFYSATKAVNIYVARMPVEFQAMFNAEIMSASS
jgi:MoxR-like ATPase